MLDNVHLSQVDIIGVVLVKQRRRRRQWADDEKRMICAQTRLPGVSVAQVARRYDVNANQVFNWLKDDRYSGSGPAEADQRFFPVELIEAPVGDRASPSALENASASCLEIELGGGQRLRVTGTYDVEALALLIRRLSS